MNRLAELRKAAGYTQKYVALELGVKAPSVCAWEKGDGNPKQENLIALAKLYGVSVDYLLGNDQPDGEPEGEPAEDKAKPHDRRGELTRMLVDNIDCVPTETLEMMVNVVRMHKEEQNKKP